MTRFLSNERFSRYVPGLMRIVSLSAAILHACSTDSRSSGTSHIRAWDSRQEKNMTRIPTIQALNIQDILK